MRCLLFALILALSVTVSAGQARSDQPSPIKSYRNLFKLLNQKNPLFTFNTPFGGGGPFIFSDAVESTLGGAVPAGPGAATTGAGGAKVSATNVQVAGVDEADIVKSDGQYIYHVNRQRVLITKAMPAGELEVKSQLDFSSEFSPIEMFLENDLLVVIGAGMRSTPVEKGVDLTSMTVKAMVFNIADRSKVQTVREVELDGTYLSSRKIDSAVYIVARKYPDFYFLPFIGDVTAARANAAPGAQSRKRTPRRRNRGLVPAVRDTARGSRAARINPSDVFFFPDFSEPNYLIVAGFDLSKPQDPADITAFLGAGEAVYASRKNLYVADSQYLAAAPANDELLPEAPTQVTHLYRFALEGGKVSFSQRGEVPGTVLNQFSMDENGDTFRVATTQNRFGFGEQSTNNLYVLNSDMKVMGKLENLAPGEQIFSARFIGERCYVVTFRVIDPLFVISLADPTAPVVLGELKIPGFSDYLHPYDENHLIGFGKETVDGFYQGMKLSCFDVSDVKNPVQKHAITIGDRGTHSEVLYNHKALLFDKDKGLIGFPLSVYEVKDRTAQTPPWAYGEPVFQGAHVYGFSLENGFALRKAITHDAPAVVDPQKPEFFFFFDYTSAVRRLLTIDQNLYSVSDVKIQVHDLTSFDEIKSLDLP
ncbi:MAG TPA: beta-propeller domain-containing protein [Planctomycetota bacterium]|nr:beta-propeller domain-containing protein [Planctomycetota bacterium]